MVGRGDLLALIRGAPGPLRTLEAALIRWVDTGSVVAVHDHLRRTRGPNGDARVEGPPAEPALKAASPDREGPAAVEESSFYVLVELPDRWRVVGRGHIAVNDGHQSWMGTGSLVTERDSSRATIHDAGPIGACLYPGPLLGWLDFGDPEPDERAGRFCWTVDAYPRPLAGASGASGAAGGSEPAVAPLTSRLTGGFLGVEHRFWFEARTGIVLRHEGSVEGRPCSTTELTDVVVDEAIPADEFAPPPEAMVRSSHELLRDHLTELGVDPDTVDLDDPGQVRRALRQGAASGPASDPGSPSAEAGFSH